MDGHNDVRRGDDGPRCDTGIAAKLGGVVKQNSRAAVGLIVVLVILLVAMFIYYNGYFGLGGKKDGLRSGRDGAAKGGDTVRGSSDAEVEGLIDSINKSQGL